MASVRIAGRPSPLNEVINRASNSARLSRETRSTAPRFVHGDKEGAGPALKGDGGLNYIYLRYADVLLMKAEAYNESGNAEQAKVYLNKVRQRARASYKGTPPADLLADVTTTDQTLLRIAVQHERRVELAQEFHRYFDLTRWGKTVAEAALGKDYKYDTNRYFPIPQAEVDANQAIK